MSINSLATPILGLNAIWKRTPCRCLVELCSTEWELVREYDREYKVPVRWMSFEIVCVPTRDAVSLHPLVDVVLSYGYELYSFEILPVGCEVEF